MIQSITALATPPGISGLAIVRISGTEAIDIADKCFSGKSKLSNSKSHTIHYGKFVFNGKLIDTVTASVFREPNSFTGENSIEITCHGGTIVAGEIIRALINSGAVLALPGEFTKRAFLNGKLDLAQVEAVADIIHSVTEQGSQTAARQLDGEFTQRLAGFREKLISIASHLELELDFADEDLKFTDNEKIISEIKQSMDFCNNLSGSFRASEILRSGYFVAILGYPNSGKSTLFNTILNRKRAIVSEQPGTTRDYLEELIYIDGIAIKLIDTAGIRDTEDLIEIEGIKMAESIIKQSNLILILNDLEKSADNSSPLYKEIENRFPENDILYVQNKTDKINNQKLEDIQRLEKNSVFISAKQKIGIEDLNKKISEFATKNTERINDVMLNHRQVTLLNTSYLELSNALSAIKNKFGNEIISLHIRNSAKFLGEITGENWNEDVLNSIFSRFCIGK